MLKSPGKIIAALVALGLGVTGLGIYLALRPAATSQRPETTANPTQTSAGQAVSALGRLEPEGRVIKVAAPSTLGSARVVQLLVREGGAVKAGQVIAVMDTRDRLLAAAIEAEAQVRQAQANVAKVKTATAKPAEVTAQQALVEAKLEEAKRREAEYRNAKLEYDRYVDLYKQGATSKSTLDSRELTLVSAQKALTQAIRELEQTKQTRISLTQVRPVDIQQAEAELQVAIANFQQAKAELETAAVRSPIDGKIIKLNAYPGEQVGADGIAEIGRTSQMYAVAEIYETDIGKVKLGQRATVTSPAFAGEMVGVVAQIGQKIAKNDVLNTDPAADTDARVVEVKIRLDNSKKVEGLTNLQVKVEIDPQSMVQPVPRRSQKSASPQRSPQVESSPPLLLEPSPQPSLLPDKR